MKSFLISITIILLNQSCSAQSKPVAEKFQPFALVELFTSEGCSSCPPADDLLKKLKTEATKTNAQVYFVAYHVDYWNKLGWKDPFSKYQFTLIQQNYLGVLDEKDMYTPQMIVNGQYSFTGSNESKAKDAIDRALKFNALVNVSVRKDSLANDTLYVSYQSSVAESDFSIKVLLLESDLKSTVTAGENKGKTLLHDNVCRAYQSKSLSNKTGQVKISVKNIIFNKNFSLVAFVQQKGSLKVLGICAGKL
ncbi:MAG: DUF1223 domain-containing protein [Bacteroidia bacterium]